MNHLRLRAACSLLAHRTPFPAVSPGLLRRPTGRPTTQQTRHGSWFSWSRKKDNDAPATSSSDSRSLLSFLKSSPKTTPAAQSTLPPVFEKGGLASTSVFGSEPTEATAAQHSTSRPMSTQEYLSVVDPSRGATWSWPRRFSARQHQRRGRLPRRMQLLQTERSHTAKSHWIKTSVKKLAPLARQIAGLPLSDAIVQMRFSAKKASTQVMNLLGEARMEAMVRRGMADADMYVSEAWVGRGTYDSEMSHRARGRIDMLRKPYTSITVVLKENATRERIEREKREKKERKKVWVHLPNRPIYGQQQYYQW
ncbi:ribosomal protein L22/L17 [Tirmania nivea]|nr:ribosomal protein L22/L17 [Tirmania nivea]